jgi:hypothetical protein
MSAISAFFGSADPLAERLPTISYCPTPATRTPNAVTPCYDLTLVIRASVSPPATNISAGTISASAVLRETKDEASRPPCRAVGRVINVLMSDSSC